MRHANVGQARRWAVAVACITLSLLLLTLAIPQAARAWRSHRDTVRARSARAVLAGRSGLLQSALYSRARPGACDYSRQDGAPRLLVVVSDTCPDCAQAVRLWRTAIGPERWGREAVVAWSGEPGAWLARANVGVQPCSELRIRDPEEYRAATGITAVPFAALLDEAHRLRLAVAGVPSAESIAAVSLERLRHNAAGAVTFELGRLGSRILATP